MNDKQIKRTSKAMSYVLRHAPESIGVTLNSAGWIDVDVFIDAMTRSGKPMDLAMLETVVAANDKQRFEFSSDRKSIRARQGHSIAVELGYEPRVPPDTLFHGTATRFIESIFREGLKPGNRHHVHLSTNTQTMLSVGRRHGKPIVLKVDARGMHRDGLLFYVTDNEVWLTKHVPVKYLEHTADV